MSLHFLPRFLLNITLSWSAPFPGCPAQGDVERAIEAQSTAGPSRDIIAKASIEPDLSSWCLRLDTTIDGVTSHREIHAPTCNELADATAVLVAIDALREEREQRRREIDPATTPSHDDEDRDRGATIDPATRDRSSRIAIGASGSISAGAFGAPAYGVIGSAAWLTGKNRFGVDAAYFAPVRISDSDQAIGGRFNLLAFGISACRSVFAAGFELAPCAGVELGRVAASGVVGGNVAQSIDESSLWAALRGGALFGYRIVGDSVLLRGDLGAIVPVIRDRFLVDGVGTVHRPAVVSFRAGLGMEVQFF